MDHETTLDGRQNGAERASPSRTLASNAAAMAYDLVSLAELQWQLLVADMRGVWSGALVAVGATIVALVIAVAAMPVALAALGLLLADATGLSPAAGMLLVVLAALVVTSGLLGAGWWHLREQLAGLERSRRELRNNLNTLKRILERHAARSPAGDENYRSSSTQL
jgi:hypothetical protein